MSTGGKLGMNNLIRKVKSLRWTTNDSLIVVMFLFSCVGFYLAFINESNLTGYAVFESNIINAILKDYWFVTLSVIGFVGLFICMKIEDGGRGK